MCLPDWVRVLEHFFHLHQWWRCTSWCMCTRYLHHQHCCPNLCGTPSEQGVASTVAKTCGDRRRLVGDVVAVLKRTAETGKCHGAFLLGLLLAGSQPVSQRCHGSLQSGTATISASAPSPGWVRGLTLSCWAVGGHCNMC